MWLQVLCIIDMKTQQHSMHRWEHIGTPRRCISNILTLLDLAHGCTKYFNTCVPWFNVSSSPSSAAAESVPRRNNFCCARFLSQTWIVSRLLGIRRPYLEYPLYHMVICWSIHNFTVSIYCPLSTAVGSGINLDIFQSMEAHNLHTATS